METCEKVSKKSFKKVSKNIFYRSLKSFLVHAKMAAHRLVDSRIAKSPGRQFFYGKHKSLFEDIVCRLNKCNFKKMADVGYLELDDTAVLEDIDAADGEAYIRWTHDAWADFIRMMHGPVRKRPLIRIHNGGVESIANLTGDMRGTQMRAKAHLIFHYCPLEWSESVFRWKVSLKPTTLSRPQSSRRYFDSSEVLRHLHTFLNQFLATIASLST